MKEIKRTRRISPSSRGETSERYKVDVEKVTNEDVLVVSISHETKPFSKTYRFRGSDIAGKNSIHFEAREIGSSIEIIWSGAMPIENTTG